MSCWSRSWTLLWGPAGSLLSRTQHWLAGSPSGSFYTTPQHVLGYRVPAPCLGQVPLLSLLHTSAPPATCGLQHRMQPGQLLSQSVPVHAGFLLSLALLCSVLPMDSGATWVSVPGSSHLCCLAEAQIPLFTTSLAAADSPRAAISFPLHPQPQWGGLGRERCRHLTALRPVLFWRQQLHCPTAVSLCSIATTASLQRCLFLCCGTYCPHRLGPPCKRLVWGDCLWGRWAAPCHSRCSTHLGVAEAAAPCALSALGLLCHVEVL